MWFEKLTGFKEVSPENVRKNIELLDGSIISKVNGKSYKYGRLEVPSLEELRERIPSLSTFNDKISVIEVVGDVQSLHKDYENAGALFQVASQFNLLEMISPEIIPERGVGIYENDNTQGPACAIACGAGTIFRNYFVEINKKIGQTLENQIDCIGDIGNALGNDNSKFWKMQNGYALVCETGLDKITKKLKTIDDVEYDVLLGKLRLGIQFDTQVTLDNCEHKVTQAYCSALPVAYSQYNKDKWTEFSKFILNAAYEATFCTGILNYLNTGNKKVYLTLLGGGAFGNRNDWITSAIRRSLKKYANTPLDIRIVSYDRPKECFRELMESR